MGWPPMMAFANLLDASNSPNLAGPPFIAPSASLRSKPIPWAANWLRSL